MPSQVWQVDASGARCATPRLVASLPEGRAAGMAVDARRRRLYVLPAQDSLVQTVWGFDLDAPGSAAVSATSLSTPVVQVSGQLLAVDPASGRALVAATCTDQVAFCLYAAPPGATNFTRLGALVVDHVCSIAFDAERGALALAVYVNGTGALLLVEPLTGGLREALDLEADEGLPSPGGLVAV